MICLTQEQRDYFETFKSGHTCIYGPDGEPISDMVPAETEGIAYADIDVERVIDYKYYIDPAGHYSNQSLSMNFNQQPTPVVKQLYPQKNEVFTYEDIQYQHGILEEKV